MGTSSLEQLGTSSEQFTVSLLKNEKSKSKRGKEEESAKDLESVLESKKEKKKKENREREGCPTVDALAKEPR